MTEPVMKVEIKFQNTQDLRVVQQFRRKMHRAGKDLGAWLAEKAKEDMYRATETDLLSAEHALDFLLLEFGKTFTHNDLKFWRGKALKPKLRKTHDYVEKPFGTKVQYFYKKKRLKKFVTELLEARRLREEKRGVRQAAEEAEKPPVRTLNVQQQIVPLKSYRGEE